MLPVALARKRAAAVETSGASTFRRPASRFLSAIFRSPLTRVPPATKLRSLRRLPCSSSAILPARSSFSPPKKALPLKPPLKDGASFGSEPSSTALKSSRPSFSLRPSSEPEGTDARAARAIRFSVPRALAFSDNGPVALSDRSAISPISTPRSKSASLLENEPLAVIAFASLPIRKPRAEKPFSERARPPLKVERPLIIRSAISSPVLIFSAVPSSVRSNPPVRSATVPVAFRSRLPASERSASAENGMRLFACKTMSPV